VPLGHYFQIETLSMDLNRDLAIGIGRSPPEPG
jgi:hypothetical protein